jgi:hypothetical protein
MKRTLVAALLFALLAMPAFADADAALRQEIERLEALAAQLEKAEIPKMADGLLAQSREFLARAEKAESPHLKLYRLRYALVGLEALRLLVETKASGESVEAMEKLWNANRARFEGKTVPAAGTLLQRALVQAAMNRADKLFHASLPYGRADGPMSGVYYIADASGYLAYAKLAASVPLAKEAAGPPSAAAIGEAVDTLEGEALKLFEKDPVGRTALAASALVKETRELVARGWLEGATLTLTEAQWDVGRKQGVKDDGGLKAPSAPLRAGAAPRDSLAALWVAAAKEDDRGDTRGSVNKLVLPLYDSLATAKVVTKKAARGPVTLTLVRWPYT